MRLHIGSSKEVVSMNICELIKSGRKPAQAIAIAFRKAGITKSNRRKLKSNA